MVHVGFKRLNAVEQVIYRNAQERRRSLAGIPEMYRTVQNTIPTDPLLAASFPGINSPITFWTSIRITGASPNGLIFGMGTSSRSIAAWVDGDKLTFRAGDTAEDDRGFAEFDNTVTLPVGLELDLVFAVRPGDGRVRIWGNGTEIARDTAVNGQMTSGWMESGDGAFAAGAGDLSDDVTQTDEPSDFDVIQPMSSYAGQVPRHFV